MSHLLIVDDDQDIAEALADCLASEGHATRVARDGLEGLHRLHSDPVDLILLDVEMPRLTGPEMAYEVFLHDAGAEKIPIILLSAKLDLPRVAAKVGTPYFLAKPYDLDALLEVIARASCERVPPSPRLDHSSRASP
jgi:DNA-binding NtrC family response regulator